MNTKIDINKSYAMWTLLGALMLAGCGKSESGSTADAAAPHRSASPLLLAEAPADAIPVGQARTQVQPGERVAVIGQIGGTPKPIAESFASFVIADQNVYFCNEMDDDQCETPWDACCEAPETLAHQRASVTFLDAAGQPLPVDLKKNVGLKELELVTVTGTVAPQSTADNMIILGEGIYRNP